MNETSKYLKFSNELFPESIDSFGRFMSDLLPEVDYRSYSYTTMLEELDCQTRECCKLSRTDYASGQPGGTETVLNRWEWGRACYDDMWMPLVPGTPEAALYKIVCAAQGGGE